MPAVLSKPLYFVSDHTLLTDQIHTREDWAMNCHWWIQRGTEIIDPTPGLPPPQHAVSEKLYFPYDEEGTKQRWRELHTVVDTTEDVDSFLCELALTGDYKIGKCYWNALAMWRASPILHAEARLVVGAVGYKVSIPDHMEYCDEYGRPSRPHMSGRYVTLDYGF